MDRLMKYQELKQAMRDALHKEHGAVLPQDAFLMMYVFDAAAYVQVVMLGRNPDDVIKALRGETS